MASRATLNPIAESNNEGFKIKQLTGIGFGCNIDGITPQNIHSQVEFIKENLSKYKVVVIDGLEDLDTREYLKLAENFGRPEYEPHPQWDDVDGIKGVKIIQPSKFGKYPQGAAVQDSWHTDGPPREKTQWFTFLYGHEVPEVGYRDTLFADMEAAYDRQSDKMKQFLNSLDAVNSWDKNALKYWKAEPVVHPVIMTDPDNGRKSIYVSPNYTKYIRGLRKEESQLVLNYLYSQSKIPELQLRVSWKKGSLVIFDTEKTQHYIVRDYNYDRILHRVMVNTGR